MLEECLGPLEAIAKANVNTALYWWEI